MTWLICDQHDCHFHHPGFHSPSDAHEHGPDVGYFLGFRLDVSATSLCICQIRRADIFTIDSIVEANLFIVCAALPTLRKFFKHIAPNLIGESRYGRSSKATNNVASTGPQKALRTIGSKTTSALSKRNQYSQFDDADDGSNHGPNECIIMSDYASSPKVADGGMSQWNGEERIWADDGSEKAIVKDNVRILRTDTVTVEYHKSS